MFLEVLINFFTPPDEFLEIELQFVSALGVPGEALQLYHHGHEPYIRPQIVKHLKEYPRNSPIVPKHNLDQEILYLDEN